MSKSTPTHYTINSTLGQGIDDNYTKKIINRIIDHILISFEEEFFKICLYAFKANTHMTYSVTVQTDMDQKHKAITIVEPISSDIHAYIKVLNSYNNNFEGYGCWNKLHITLWYTGKYRTKMRFDKDLEWLNSVKKSSLKTHRLTTSRRKKILSWQGLSHNEKRIKNSTHSHQ